MNGKNITSFLFFLFLFLLLCDFGIAAQPQVIWTYPIAGWVVAYIPDIGGDGKADVIAGSFNNLNVYLLSGANGSQIWNFTLSVGDRIGDVCYLPDVNEDGISDVVASGEDFYGGDGSNGSVYVLSGTNGTIIWNYTAFSIPYVRCIPDIDGDGKADVIVVIENNTDAPFESNVSIFNGFNGSILWSYTVYRPKSPNYIPDVNGDGKVDIMILETGILPSNLILLNGSNGAKLWNYSSLGEWITVTYLLDINNDTIPDVVAGRNDPSCGAVAFNGSNGSVIWNYTEPISSGIANLEPLDDIDGDGIIDVVAGLNTGPGTGFHLISGRNGTKIWNFTTPLQTAPYYLANLSDINKDGKFDLVGSGHWDIPSVYCLDGATGNQIWNFTSNVVFYEVAYIPDVNGDGIPDVIVGSNATVYLFSGSSTLLNLTIDKPVDGETIYLNNTFILNGTVTCEGAVNCTQTKAYAQYCSGESCTNFTYLPKSNGLILNFSTIDEWYEFHRIGISGRSLGVGDIDNDRKEEIVLTEGFITVWKWNSTLSNYSLMCNISFSGNEDVYIGDVDNDGLNEFLTYAWDGVFERNITIWKWNGTTCILNYTIPIPFYPRSIRIGNATNSEINIIASGGLDPNGISYFQAWRWNGTAYQLILNCTPPTCAGSHKGLDIGDVDNDGLNELVAAQGDGAIRVWKWNGTNFIINWTGPSWAAIRDLRVGDVDGDGIDEIVAGGNVPANLSVWKWNGSEYNLIANFISDAPQRIAIGDVDNDGLNEFVTGNEPESTGQPKIRVWKWNGTNFTSTWEELFSVPNDLIPHVRIGDTDNDGLNEIIAIDTVPAIAKVLKWRSYLNCGNLTPSTTCNVSWIVKGNKVGVYEVRFLATSNTTPINYTESRTLKVLSLIINITTNQTSYTPGQTVLAYGWFGYTNGTALANKNVTVKFVNTTNQIVQERNVTTSSTGWYNDTYSLPFTASTGIWRVNVTGFEDGTVSSSITFSVASAGLSIDTPVVIPTIVNPGDSFTVKANVTELAGISYINETNVTCFGLGGVEGIDSWDSYTKLNASLNWSIIDIDTIEVSATITLNTSSINGTWTCKVYALNASGYSTYSEVNQPLVNTRVGIIVSTSSCEFDQGLPGDVNKNWTCPSGGSNYLRYIHDGNININVKINGTNLVGQTYSNWVIGVGNITYRNVTGGTSPPSPPGIQLTTAPTNLVGVWSRGTYPNKNANDLYCWLSYPTPLKVQTYQGTILLIAEAV